MLLKAGTFLTLTAGVYSDYRFYGPFRVVKAFDQAEAAAQYVASLPAGKPPYWWPSTPDPEGFIAWLTAQDFIEDAPNNFEWHLGDWDFEPVIVVDTAFSG